MDVRDVPLHLPGTHIIVWLQELCWPLREQVVVASRLGDPASAYVLVFPIAFALSHALGRRVLWAACIGEWLNIILKWLLRGQRPYWWVEESHLWRDKPPLKQFEITCETGPGSPSGHAMISAAVWYQLADALSVITSKHGKPSSTHHWPWLVYSGSLFAVSVSRLFIATHFPHQVVLGLICGIFLARWLITYNSTFSQAGFAFHLAATFLLVIGAFAFYFILLLVGVDPSSSVKLALQHCAKQSWVHLDTTPFYSLFRASGSILGLGVMTFMWQSNRQPQRYTTIHCLATIVASLLVAQLLLRVPLPMITKNTTFYAASFLRYAALPPVVAFCCHAVTKFI